MKKIYKLYLLLFAFWFVKIQTGYSQAPALSAIQGQTVICIPATNGFTYSVSATNNPTSYNWGIYGTNGIAALSSPYASSTTISFSIYATYATYTLACFAQNGSGMSPLVSIVIKVFETPSVTFSGANSFCQGSSAGISASSTLFQSSSTTISWSPATGLSSTSLPSVVANPPVTTNYTVLTSNGPCASTNYFLVTVNPAPTVSAVFSPSLICQGEKSILTITGSAATYSVNGISFSSPATYSPTSSTLYSLSSTGANGCHSATTTVALSVNPCVGLSEWKKTNSSLNFYPNPNNGSFVIRSEKDQTLVIVTEVGLHLKTLELNANSETRITGLSTGVYFLLVGDQKRKIIVTP